MYYKLKFAVVLSVLIIGSINAQRLFKISVSIDGETKRLSYFVNKGTVFISSKELVRILSGNYYINNKTAKAELKFKNYKLKVTSENRFVVLISRKDNSQKIFQISSTPRQMNNDMFIPLEDCLPYLNAAYESRIEFNNGRKHLKVAINPQNTIAANTTIRTATYPGVFKRFAAENINSKYDVYGLIVEEKPNGTLITVRSKRRIIRYSSAIRNGILYLFMSGVSVDPVVSKESKPVGYVKRVKKKTISSNVQLEFLLKKGYTSSEAFQDPESNDLFITIHSPMLTEVDRDMLTEINKWQFDVIVIDPGHGGRDPGAIGITGVKEKNINLGIALKLGKLLEENMDSVKVVYTRKTDKFVELYKRGKIANENKGKFFISIHCNSLGINRPDIRGFEVYLLRPGRTEEAIAIAEFENSVIEYEDDPEKYKKLTDENFILVSMAHASYMRYSEKFSDILNQEWMHEIKIPSRGIKQAGFYVLVGASMPGVLIESGFLSNKKDEKYLNSTKGQRQIAETLFRAVKKYKDYYDKSFIDGG